VDETETWTQNADLTTKPTNLMTMHRVPTQTLFVLVYVLELEGGNYYVGITQNLNIRYYQHCSGFGSKWTRLHKPVRIVSAEPGGEAKEREVTLEMMKEHGWDKVRGGPWCKIDMRQPPECLR